MKETVKRIIDFIDRHSMFSEGAGVLAAVSGGADSMCLLHILRSLESELGIRVSAAHFEHGIRGEESMRDCEFVRNYCCRESIPFICEHGDVPAYASEHGIGTEEAARILRYEFLERARSSLGCDVIATAHNMDDNAETVLFNLARGAGTAGLAGIPVVRGNIVRPILCLTRNEIEDYVRENEVPYVVDSSNLTDDYSRNRIRHKVLPEIKSVSDSSVEAIFRASQLLREDDECLNSLADEFISSECIVGTDGEKSVLSSGLQALPKAVSSRVVRKLFGRSLSLEQTEAILRIAETTEIASVSLPGGSVSAEQGRLFFNRDLLLNPPGFRKEIVPGKSVFIPEIGTTVLCEEVTYNTEIRKEVHGLLNTLCLNCGEISGKLYCTSRTPGDSMRVYRRGCTKTLKSLFMEAKMTQSERDSTPVFRDDSGVLAAAGLAISERAAPVIGGRAYIIKLEKENRAKQ